MLVCDSLEVNFSNESIFKNLSFSLFPGSSLQITGANGSGKSTLLRVIAGLKKQNSGEISWQNRNIYSDIDLYRSSQISYLGHSLAIKPFLSVYDNIYYFSSLKNNSSIIMATLKHFEILHLMDTKAYLLSAGNLKRLALAITISSGGDLWILDEPDSALDKEGKEQLSTLISIKTKEGGVVVFTSHDHNLTNQVAQLNIMDFK
jgi:heme exporter protein A